MQSSEVPSASSGWFGGHYICPGLYWLCNKLSYPGHYFCPVVSLVQVAPVLKPIHIVYNPWKKLSSAIFTELACMELSEVYITRWPELYQSCSMPHTTTFDNKKYEKSSFLCILGVAWTLGTENCNVRGQSASLSYSQLLLVVRPWTLTLPQHSSFVNLSIVESHLIYLYLFHQ